MVRTPYDRNCAPEWFDASAADVSGDGVQWTLESSADLNVNLVHLDPGHAVDDHVNGEVDVVVVVLAGSGSVTVDGSAVVLGPGVVAHLPKGSRRRIDAGDGGLRHLTVHRRRGPLSIGRRRDRDEGGDPPCWAEQFPEHLGLDDPG